MGRIGVRLQSQRGFVTNLIAELVKANYNRIQTSSLLEKQAMLPEVSAVQPLPDYVLRLTFTNGEQKQFDMTPYLHYPIFQHLQNPGFFKLAKVDYGTVVWPGEIDIAPETLYLDSEIV